MAAFLLGHGARSASSKRLATKNFDSADSRKHFRETVYTLDQNIDDIEALREYYEQMGPMYATTFDAGKFEESWGRGIRNFEQLNFGFSGFLRTFDFSEQLHTIKCPTLVLMGDSGHLGYGEAGNRALAEEFIALAPNASLKLIADGGGTYCMIETPEATAAAVVEFINGL